MSRYKNVYGIKKATQTIPSFGEVIKQPSDIYLTYVSSDRLDLISHRIYGDPQYWWVILAANNYQMEFDIESGEILRVPYPLPEVLNSMRDAING